ncbi:MAG TPA: hypothetical protein VGF08_14435, partial [Terriglobales bacterium]
MNFDTMAASLPDWKRMSVERYAAEEIATGEKKITRQGEVYWRQVRRFFYRPLPPFIPHDLETTTRNFNVLAAFQHGVLPGQPSNSEIQLMTFGDLGGYSIDKLDYRVAKNIKRA